MANTRFRESFSDHMVELRFKPNAKMLDRRGECAEKLSAALDLPLWSIRDNRIDVFAKDKKRGVFVTHANAGVVCQDLTHPEDFADIAEKAFWAIFVLPNFGDRITARRLGVRSKFLTKFEGTFEELRTLCLERCVKPQDGYLEIMKAHLEDVGAPLNFVDEHGHFNTHCGPMLEKQAKELVERKHDLFPVSLYFDIDYWKTPEDKIGARDSIQFIQLCGRLEWEKCRAIIGLLGNA